MTFKVKGRTFVLLETAAKQWTFQEVLPNGDQVDPSDIIPCEGPMAFVRFHVETTVGRIK
jgi:hypothetical protein